MVAHQDESLIAENCLNLGLERALSGGLKLVQDNPWNGINNIFSSERSRHNLVLLSLSINLKQKKVGSNQIWHDKTDNDYIYGPFP